MGFFDMLFSKKIYKQEENSIFNKEIQKRNQERIGELLYKCTQKELKLIAKVKKGDDLNNNEIIEIQNSIKNNPELYKELWVRLTGNLEWATNEEIIKWFGDKNV